MRRKTPISCYLTCTRDGLRTNMERVAVENGIEIEFVRSRKIFRKEDRVKEMPTRRGELPGVVGILSAMEMCIATGPAYSLRTRSYNAAMGTLRSIAVNSQTPFRPRTSLIRQIPASSLV